MKRILLVAASSALALSGSADAAIVVDGTATAGARYTSFTNGTLEFNFDASGSDKLVVVAASEGGSGASAGQRITGITYGGVALTEAEQADNNGDFATLGSGFIGIYYLDDPGAAGIIAAQGSTNENSWLYMIYALSGTKDGAEGIGGTAIGQATSSASSLSGTLAATGTNSLIINAAMNSTEVSSSPTAQAPTTDNQLSVVSGGGWTAATSATHTNAGPGNVALSWANTGGSKFAAVEFLAVPEPSSLALMGLGGLLIAHRRRA